MKSSQIGDRLLHLSDREQWRAWVREHHRSDTVASESAIDVESRAS